MTNNLPPPADPFIPWPGETDDELRSILPELQRLNPTLNLRCAVTRSEAADWPILVECDDGPPVKEIEHIPASDSEFLVYDGTALDLVPITMPEPPSDEMMSGFTEVNRESMHYQTDLGAFCTGPRRIERTAAGLLIRPRSENVEKAFFRCAFQQDITSHLDQFRRMKDRWGIVRESDVLWEVEYAYLPANHRNRPDGTRKDDREWWATIPIGTISYIDQYDLPIENHYERAREIIKAGSDFAIVGDLRVGDLRIFRQSGDKRVTKDIQIPEMPWYKVPVVQSDINLQNNVTIPRQANRSI